MASRVAEWMQNMLKGEGGYVASKKAEQKRIDQRIEVVYRQRCQNIQIPIMRISEVFNVGRAAIAEGADDQALGDKIAAFVDTIKS